MGILITRVLKPINYLYVWFDVCSLPKAKSLIESDIGLRFAPLYMTLRIHGIADS